MRRVPGHESIIGMGKLIGASTRTAKHPRTRGLRQCKEQCASLMSMAPPQGSTLNTTELAVNNIGERGDVIKVFNIRRVPDNPMGAVTSPLDPTSSRRLMSAKEEVMRP